MSRFIEMIGSKDVQNFKIKELCDVRGGATPSKSNDAFWIGGTMPWFTIDDIKEQGHYIYDTKQKVTNAALSKLFVYPKNTVLLCCTASLGEYAITMYPMTSNQQFNGLMVKDVERLNPLFLLYYASTLKPTLLKLSGKTTIHFVSRSSVENIELKLPSIGIQNKFVKVVQQADKSKFELREAIKRVESMMKSLMN